MPNVRTLLGLAVAAVMCVALCSHNAVAETPCAAAMVQAERNIATNTSLPVKDKVKEYTNIRDAYLACLGETKKLAKWIAMPCF